MRRVICGVLAGAILNSGATAASKAPIVPTEKWVVNFDDAQCIASRNYGTKDSPLIVILKEPPLGDVMRVSVLRHGRADKFAQQLDGSISLDGAAPVRSSVLLMGVPENGDILFSMNLSRPEFLKVANSKTVRIDGGWRLDENFELSSMPALVKVLDQCVTGLREVWNVSEQGVSNPKLLRGTSGTLQNIFTSEDYPDVAMNRNDQGSVTFALLVDEKGSVADCSVIKTSGIAALDAQSCAKVKLRAHFGPAIGLDGKAVKSATTSTITWRIED